jgi:histidinol-phosphate aminotransferase
MSSFFRPAIEQMTGYTPGEQPRPGTPVIKLNTNENPYPPSPQALAVLRSLDSEWLRRYPTPYANDMRQAVSDVLEVPQDWIMVGNGSDELLNVIVRACAEPDRKVVYPTPTYVLYPMLAAMQGVEVVEIPYGLDLRLPVAELVAARGAVTFIASPNSPTAHVVGLAELRELAKQITGVLVIDEAYVDFANETALSLVHEFNHVIIVRTLSKGYSLAGLRLGFAIAHPDLLQGLFKVKDSYNIDAIACLVGAAAIRDQAYKNECVARVKAAREQLAIALKQLNFAVWESQTNFLLTQPCDRPAAQLYQELKERGILIRYFDHSGLEDKLRITVGTEAQNQTLITTLHQLLQHNCVDRRQSEL